MKIIRNYSFLGTTKQLVTTEEIVIILIVMLIWIAVITLFVRKWGKIRSMEPFTPTFDQSASFSIPPPTPLSAIVKKNCSVSRDTIISSHNNTDSLTSEKFTIHMPVGRVRPRAASASSPDVRTVRNSSHTSARITSPKKRDHDFIDPCIIEETEKRTDNV